MRVGYDAVPIWRNTILVTTGLDLLMAHMGVPRGLPGDYPSDYDDPKPYAPSWQEQETKISRKVAIQIAREWAENAEKTRGKSLIIAGPGATHWYHSDLYQRFGVLLGALTGCHGVNGGGWCHCTHCRELSDPDQALIVENRILTPLRKDDPNAQRAHPA